MMSKAPKFLDIELNTSCNLSCKMCPYLEVHTHPQYMDIRIYEKIIEQIDWECSLKLCQRGEPLLAPFLLLAIQMAKRKGLRVVMNTNGILLDKFASALVVSGIDIIWLSDYNILRQRKNVEQFDYINKFHGSPVKLIIKTDNVEKWKGVGAQFITPFYYDYSDTSKDFTPLPNWKCSQLFDRLIIEPNGKVRCCCGYIHPEKYVGNINTQSILDIWNDIHAEYCRIHDAGQSHILDMCVSCAARKEEVKKRNELSL